MNTPRTTYPSDVTDDEWALVAPYLTLMDEAAPQRQYVLREGFNALRQIVRTGAPWRMLPHDLPPWPAVYQQTQHWLAAECFETLADDLRALLRVADGRHEAPSAVILDARTLQSTPESGGRAVYDGRKPKRGSKLHAAVDTLGHLQAATVTPANKQARSQVEALAAEVQAVTGQHVELAYVDQGPGRKRRPMTPITGLRWRWCGCRRPNGTSSCCPAAGWSNAPSPGRLASAAWPKITNACQKR